MKEERTGISTSAFFSTGEMLVMGNIQHDGKVLKLLRGSNDICYIASSL
jgi:hypothetical protein